MFKLRYVTIVIVIIISIDLLISTINVDAEDCYGYGRLGDFRIWRWYQALVINEDGTTKAWIRIDFQILKRGMNNYVGITLDDIPAREDQIIYYPHNGTEASYVEFNVTEDGIKQNYSEITLHLKPEVGLFYEHFSVCIQYNVSKDSILFKKSSKYSAIEKWELDHKISVSKELFMKDPSIEKKLTGPFIQIFIVLPKTASVSYMDENFHFYHKDKYGHLDSFQKLSYCGWDGKEIDNRYQIPFEIPQISNVVLNYIESYTPGYFSVEYSTENEDFAEFTYKAMKAGIESKNIAWISLGIATISALIAIFAYMDSRKYQHKIATTVIEEKIAMMYEYNARVKDFERKKGEETLYYTFKRINRDLSIPFNLISSYLKNWIKIKKWFKIFSIRIEQLKKLIDLTNEFLNTLSEELKEKHQRPVKEIENTFKGMRKVYHRVRSKVK